MILPDSSVWIDHFRSENAVMMEHLRLIRVVMHPYVLGELALGSLANRSKLLEALGDLPHLNVAETEEVRKLIERRKLYSKGIGWVDVHLLASTLMHPSTQLWTMDKRLGRAASEMGIFLHRGSLPN